MVPYTQNYSWYVYFTVKHGTGIFTVEISRMKVSKCFLMFRTLPHGYVHRNYTTTVLSKIDRAPY